MTPKQFADQYCQKEGYKDFADFYMNALTNEDLEKLVIGMMQAYALSVLPAEEEFSFSIEKKNIRDEFAMRAPEEVPAWFPGVKQEVIRRPKHWTEYDELSEERKIFKDWHEDPCYDLEGEFKHYQDEWESYNSKSYDAIEKAQEQTYFKWRYYYADQMMKEREL